MEYMTKTSNLWEITMNQKDKKEQEFSYNLAYGMSIIFEWYTDILSPIKTNLFIFLDRWKDSPIIILLIVKEFVLGISGSQKNLGKSSHWIKINRKRILISYFYQIFNF